MGEPGQPFGHKSMDSMADCYASAIVHTQPKGPYNVAGYSFGGVVAFETAKRLEGLGHDVDFLAMLNIPPHIKSRMDYLDWGKVSSTCVGSWTLSRRTTKIIS